MAVLFPKARAWRHALRDFFVIGLPLHWRRLRYGSYFGKTTIPAPCGTQETTREWVAGFTPAFFQKKPALTFLGEMESQVGTFSREALPRTIQPETLEVFREHLRYEVPQSFVVRLPGGRTAGLYGGILTPDNLALSDVSRHARARFPSPPFDDPDELPSVTWRTDAIAVIACASHSYYHWMFDMLPRLEILRRAGIDLERLAGIVINRPKYPPQGVTLDLLGIPVEKRIFAERKLHLGSSDLLVPSFADRPFECPPWVCTFLRDSFLPHASAASFPTKFYISRKKARTRRLENEDELLPLLMENGFVEVNLEDMPFCDQVALFARAEQIVGVHGAAFANIVFCQPGTKILEIFPRNRLLHLYWGLASAVRLEYHSLVAEETTKIGPENPDPSIRLEETLWKAAVGEFLG